MFQVMGGTYQTNMLLLALNYNYGKLILIDSAKDC